MESLTEMIKGALSGANFTKVYGPASQYKCYSLHCLHSVRNTSKSQTYNHDTYRQIGVKNETIKRTKTLGMLNSIKRTSGKKRLTLFEQQSHPKSLVTQRINHPNDKCILAANLLAMNVVAAKSYTLCGWMVITILIANLTSITMATDLFLCHFLFTKCTPYQMNIGINREIFPHWA